MIKYFLRRVVMLIPVLLGVMFVVFTLMYITPGDPASMMLGEDASAEAIAEFRRLEGLDQPFIIQFVRYAKKVIIDLDLGTSYLTKRTVSDEIFARYPTTILLAVMSVLVAVAIGIPMGIISATRQYSIFDNVATIMAMMGVSMPSFWQGMLFILFFSLKLGWLPSSGFYTPAHWVLPALTIGTSSAGMITRMTRSSMLEVIRQDYIRTAKAKGQSELMVIIKHALKNALIPVITIIGLQLGNSLGGAILTESIFSIPGLGKLMVDAIKQRDYPVVQGGVLFIAIIFCAINLIVDMLYAYIDPRIKSQYASNKKAPKKEKDGGGGNE